jgi:hypothetical protein
MIDGRKCTKLFFYYLSIKVVVLYLVDLSCMLKAIEMRYTELSDAYQVELPSIKDVAMVTLSVESWPSGYRL